MILTSYLVMLLFAAVLLSPKDSNAEVIAFDEHEEMPWQCDKPDEKNKWFSLNCKPKIGWICETNDCDPEQQ